MKHEDKVTMKPQWN